MHIHNNTVTNRVVCKCGHWKQLSEDAECMGVEDIEKNLWLDVKPHIIHKIRITKVSVIGTHSEGVREEIVKKKLATIHMLENEEEEGQRHDGRTRWRWT